MLKPQYKLCLYPSESPTRILLPLEHVIPATTMLLPQHTAAEAVLGVMS